MSRIWCHHEVTVYQILCYSHQVPTRMAILYELKKAQAPIVKLFLPELSRDYIWVFEKSRENDSIIVRWRPKSKEREEALNALTKLSQEMGLYD